MLLITDSGIGSGLKRRIERRVRKKLCKSMLVKVSRPDSEDNPLLSCSEVKGPSIVPEGEGIDMFICAFVGVGFDFAADAQVTVRILWVLDSHGNFGTGFHVAFLRATFGCVNENVLAVEAEPDGSYLWGAISHESG